VTRELLGLLGAGLLGWGLGGVLFWIFGGTFTPSDAICISLGLFLVLASD
jgi:hypothetical protein